MDTLFMRRLGLLIALILLPFLSTAQEVRSSHTLSERLFAEGTIALLTEKPLLAYYQLMASYRLSPSGVTAFALGNLLRSVSSEQAAEWYQKAFEADPSQDEYAFQYGYALANQGNTDKLVHMIDEHMKLSPSDTRNQLLVLGVLLEQQKYDLVSKRLPSLLENAKGTPFYPNALQMAQQVAFDTNDVATMSRYVDAALEYHGQSLNDLASLLLQLKDNLSAEVAYQALQKVEPAQRRSSIISYVEGSILLALERYDEIFPILTRLEKSRDLEPAIIQEMFQDFLSKFSDRQLDLSPFLPIYQNFVKRNPLQFTAQLNLQSIYYMLGFRKERRAQLLRMTELFPTGHPELWHELLQDNLVEGEHQELYELFPRAIKQYPQAGSLYLIKSLAEETSGNLEAAEKTVWEGIAQADAANTNELSDLYGQAGDLANALKKIEKAILAYEQAITLNDRNATALNNYAYFLITEMNPPLVDKAVGLASRAVAIKPNDFRLFDTYGLALAAQKNYVQAEIYMRQAIELAESSLKEDPTSVTGESLANYYLHYAGVQEDLGNLQVSITYLTKMKQWIKEPWVDDLITRLTLRLKQQK